MIAGFAVWTLCALCFAAAAVWCRRSKGPVHFFTSGEKPDVRDVKGYNRAVSRLWLTGGLLFEALGLPFLFAGQNAPLLVIILLGAPILLLGMGAAWFVISNRYR